MATAISAAMAGQDQRARSPTRAARVIPCRAVRARRRDGTAARSSRPSAGAAGRRQGPRTSGIHRTTWTPVWRVEGELDEQREADHDEADDHHDEDGRTIAGIGEGEIQAAVWHSAARPSGSPTNRRPSPQRGHRPCQPRWPAAAGRWPCRLRSWRSFARLPEGKPLRPSRGLARPSRPRCRWRRTGTARPRRRSASTRPPPRSRNAAAA